MSSIRIFLIFFTFLFFVSAAGQEKNKFDYDSSALDIRKFEPSKVEKLKADPEFDYGLSPAAVNLWERFKRWLGNLLANLFEAAASANWFNILIFILVVVGLVYVVMRLLKVDALKMIYGKKTEKLSPGVLDEDIHTMDYENLVEDARQRKEYRLAIRLLFLYALKLLADNHHILWQPGKTNHEYVDELTTQNLKTGFNELSFYFEYAWYGNFSINETLYKKVNNLFINWRANM